MSFYLMELMRRRFAQGGRQRANIALLAPLGWP